jgi:hypothetical protein
VLISYSILLDIGSKSSIHIQAWLCEGRPQGDQILPESPVQQASLSANSLQHDSDRQLILPPE